MKRKKYILLSCMLFLCFSAFITIKTPLFRKPPNWPEPAYDFSKNPLSERKIQLGRILFYDPILSRNNTISCSSCHLQYTAFTHVDHALSHGIEDRIGTRNSPALVNLAWHKSFMWDGSINHLDMQALAPMSNPSEMDESIDKIVHKLQGTTLYPKLFYDAFDDSIITGEYVLKSIAQFMLTIVSANSKYDSVMRNQATFTLQENNGYILFKKHCAVCHTEPLFTNLQFENNGLEVDSTLKDYGRMLITNRSEDSITFKVPTLRNIEFSYPYMHDGRFKKLNDVLKHYTTGIHASKTLSKYLKDPIVLSSNDKVDLVTFLLTLTDKHFLFDPQYSYPRSVFYPDSKK